MGDKASALEPLHLTEENREAIRAFVRKFMPDFEEKVWEETNAKAAKLKAEKDLIDQMRQRVNQASGAYAQQMAAQIYNTSPLMQQLLNQQQANQQQLTYNGSQWQSELANALGGGGMDSTQRAVTRRSYVSVGTGFSVYDDAAEQGLTLSKP